MARNLGLVSQEKICDWCMVNANDPLAIAFLDASSAVEVLRACTSIGAWSEHRKIGEGKADHLAMSSAARDGRDAIGRGILKNIKRLEKCSVAVKP